MPRGHPQHDAEDPGAQAGAPFELGQAAMNDEKNILGSVFERRFGNTQAT